MNLDEDKPIDVHVNVNINQKLFVISLLGLTGSVLLTGFLLYFFSSGFIPTISSVIIGIVLMFFSLYFPINSSDFFQVKSEIIDIDEY